MSELFMISIDEYPYSSVCVKEGSVFSNNLQWDSGVRNLKLIQLENHNYMMDSVNLENYS